MSYKLVKALSPSAISSTSTVDAISGADLVMDWKMNINSHALAGLTEGTDYYFAVLVKDAAGNMSLYSPQLVTTLDKTAPVHGANISFTNLTDTSVTVSWGPASDNSMAQNGMKYKLVKASTASAIDTISEADAGVFLLLDLSMDWSENAVSCTVNELKHGTTYYFAVLVKDGAGNMAIYSPQSVQTASIPTWAKTVSSAASYSLFTSISMDSSGNVYAAGSILCSGIFDFGFSVTTASPYSDTNALLVKYY